TDRGFLNSSVLCAMFGLHAGNRARRFVSVALGSRVCIRSRTCKTASVPNLAETWASNSNSHLLIDLLTQSKDKNIAGGHAGNMRTDPQALPINSGSRKSRGTKAPRTARLISPSNLLIFPELYALILTMCNAMTSLHSSRDSFPFKNSGSIKSASGTPSGPSQSSGEITGFEISQPTPPRSNLPQKICLYQKRDSSWTASSRVICRIAPSSGLGPDFIRSYQLKRRSLSKSGYHSRFPL